MYKISLNVNNHITEILSSIDKTSSEGGHK